MRNTIRKKSASDNRCSSSSESKGGWGYADHLLGNSLVSAFSLYNSRTFKGDRQKQGPRSRIVAGGGGGDKGRGRDMSRL